MRRSDRSRCPLLILLVLPVAVLVAGCDAPPPAGADAGADQAAMSSPDTGAVSDGSAAPAEDAARAGDAAMSGGTSGIFCNEAPPAGARLAPPAPRYSGGTCPRLMAGKNAMKSTGHDRSFLLAVPKGLRPDERLPVIFLWHWLGGTAQKFYDRGEVQAAVDSQRFLAVLPEARGDLVFKWPFEVLDSAGRQEEEFRFFDDMLACVSEQFNANANCVGSAGVSAGALFTDQLAGGRGQYLSSIISLSGGVGDGSSGQLVKPWTAPAHKLPALVLWGGPLDICIVINFQTASRHLESALKTGNHFFLECIHNCKHGEPPFTPPPGLSKYAALWRFVFDHPYWLAPGASPYKTSGIPAGYPDWCGIGAGSARPRTGMCPAPGC